MKKILLSLMLLGLAILPAGAIDLMPDSIGGAAVKGDLASGQAVTLGFDTPTPGISLDALFTRASEGNTRVWPGISLRLVRVKVLTGFVGVCRPSADYGQVRIGDLKLRAAAYAGAKVVF